MTAAIEHFEGPEKKLEIILNSPCPNLRSNHDGRWERVVSASRSFIISSISTAGVDAYLLSESSLFVWEDRILMITCGKTTLVNAVPEILRLTGRRNVARVFYERKNMLYPDQQSTQFEDDVARMAGFFSGRAHLLGAASDDHIHLYTAGAGAPKPPRQATLQVLMHDLAPAVQACFSVRRAGTAARAETLSGLDRVYPDMARDSHLFSPHGFSANAVAGKSYHTVHVTPQPQNSYASFETNRFERDYRGTIQQVVSIFKPRRLMVLLTTARNTPGPRAYPSATAPLQGYRLTRSGRHDFDCGISVSISNHSCA
ncbi:MAG: hypothetical protein WAK57_07235 [Desulfobacterales bacterium]